jgi:Ni/Co efflux regulator RcnB
MRDDMTRFLMIAAAAAFVALPAAAPALACGAHDHTAQATSVDLAAAAKKALPTPADTSDKSGDKQAAPAK